MLDYLVNGGQVVAGIAVLVVWWVVLRLLARIYGDKPLSTFMFAAMPTLLILWFIAGAVLVLSGAGYMK